jgi:hypothetical protein
MGAMLLFQAPLFAAMVGLQPVNGSSFAFGGALTLKDSHWHYHNAFLMAIGGDMSVVSSRRPVHGLFSSLLMVASNFDLWRLYLLRAALIGLAAWPFLRLYARMFGLPAMVVALGTILIVIFWAMPTFMTAPTGLFFGLCAASAFLAGVESRRAWWMAAAACLLLLGFAARSGPYFLVPACLVLGAALAWLEKSSLRIYLLQVVLAVAIGLMAPRAITASYNGDAKSFQGNFSYVLYQMAVGGENWRQILVDHPEFTELKNRSDQYDFIYEKAWIAIRDNPTTIIQSYISQLGRMPKLITNAIVWEYLLVTDMRDGVSEEILQYVFFGFFLIVLFGIVRYLAKEQSRWRRLGLLVLLAGFVFSLPFLTITTQGEVVSLRVYAVVFPLLAGLVGLPLAIYGRSAEASESASGTRPVRPINLMPLFLAAIILVAGFTVPKTLGPSIFGSDLLLAAQKRGKKSKGKHVIALGPHVPFIRVVDDRPGKVLRPDVEWSEVAEHPHLQKFPEAFGDLVPGDQVMNAIELRRNRRYFLFMKKLCVPDRRWLFEAQVERKLPKAPFYVLKSIKPLGLTPEQTASGELPYGCL